MSAPSKHVVGEWIRTLKVKPTEKLVLMLLYDRAAPDADGHLALDPTEPVPDPQHWPFPRRVKALHPPDALVQFHGTGNDGASELVTLAARAVAEGTLVPDSDHAEAWRRSIKLTAEHIRHGGHPDIETEPAA